MKKHLWLTILGVLAIAVPALAQRHMTIPQGTDVTLTFDQAVSSKTAKPGDLIKLHVTNSVTVNKAVAIPAGTKVTGVISDVSKSGRFGKNAKLRLTLEPFKVKGMTVQLQPRQRGKEFKGSKTDKAAIASGAGAVLLGPVGLAGGVFIVGKSIEIKVGDTLVTQVSKTTGR